MHVSSHTRRRRDTILSQAHQDKTLLQSPEGLCHAKEEWLRRIQASVTAKLWKSSARRSFGDGLLSPRKLSTLFRRAGERLHVVEERKRQRRGRRRVPCPIQSSDISEHGYCTKCGGHVLVEHPTLGLMDVRIGALPNPQLLPPISPPCRCEPCTSRPRIGSELHLSNSLGVQARPQRLR